MEQMVDRGIPLFGEMLSFIIWIMINLTTVFFFSFFF